MKDSLASPEISAAVEEAVAWCMAEVRRFDPDRYFASLFADERGRRALASLYAFNLEIAKTREAVSEPMLGQIRLQWWREAIDGIYAGAPRRHAVVTALAETVERHRLSRERFERMIDGRERDLDDAPFETVDDLVAYADATSGELSCLALEALGSDGETAMAVGRSAGIGWALSGLLRAVPFHAAQGRSYLPGISGDLLRQNPGAPAVVRATGQVIAAARNAVAEAGRKSYALPRAARPAVMHNVLAGSDLTRIEKAGNDPFRMRAATPGIRRLRVAVSSLTGQL